MRDYAPSTSGHRTAARRRALRLAALAVVLLEVLCGLLASRHFRAANARRPRTGFALPALPPPPAAGPSAAIASPAPVAPVTPAAPDGVLGEIEAPTLESPALEGIPADLLARLRASPPDVLVVLGARVRHGAPGRHLTRRMLAALALYEALDRRPALLLSGGRGEALAMRDFMLEHGVAPADLLLETRSRDTVQNARYSMAILERRPTRFRSALLVTTSVRRRHDVDDHAHRALVSFARYCHRIRVAAVGVSMDPDVEPRVYLSAASVRRSRHHAHSS